MKILFPLLFLLTAVFSFAQKVDYEKLIPGMSTAEFRKVVPNVIPSEDFYTGRGSEKMVFENIEGFWEYEFTQNILTTSFFKSFDHVEFRDVNEGVSASTKEKFVHFYRSCDRILTDLTKKYGEPASLRKDDTAGITFTRSTESILLISAEWKLEGFSIRFNSQYDGRTPTDRYQNNINAAPESYGFAVNMQFSGKESESKMHFRLGETAQEMEKRNPNIFKNGTNFFGSYSSEETWNGLEGGWQFCFKNGKLANAGYDFYYHENDSDRPFDEKTYNQLMKNYRKIKEEVTSKLGKTDSGYDSIPDYKILMKDKHITGNDFLFHKWKLKDRILIEELRYHYGGKGEYESSLSFTFRIVDLEGKYSYCDR